jgi:hypothetical protein
MDIMRAMRSKRISLSICVVFLGLAQGAMAAPACSVNAKIPAAARVFAKISNHGSWHEYGSMDRVPDLVLDSGMSAQFWREAKKRQSVYIVRPGQSFWTYTRYCFDKEGQLEGVGFSITTPLGWGIRTDGSMSVGAINAISSEFFDTRSGKAIPRPAGVGEFPVELRPPLYLTVSDLPFAPLLEGQKKASTESKPAPKLGTMAASRLR